ncbi:S8 family serine peptidase [Lentibacillus sp. N15]|uniref:S8 family serine peptidase n=1 Tax=Lentibacillus songyuanensis TaxID=3136161 RepID=UPI0031B9F7C1
MRRLTCLFISFTLLLGQHVVSAHQDVDEDKDDTTSIIIEVDGDPAEHKDYIETYYPNVEVVATYNKLFHGLALRGDPKKLSKMGSLEFIKAVHPVATYEANDRTFSRNKDQLDEDNTNAVLPGDLNDTSYTGKGVKVGIIDTGIDYNHPDLKSNYQQGYDLVDLDDDPMETTASQGEPTFHGTHVAGIIAADGKLKGVAPDAKIFAYRALGPGGQGTSVQVIAALEQAVDDGVDVINLSLGNTVNGPDYPTSIAVNRAVEHGVAVVIANGNSGPDDWTVGSPATASKALSVGALAMPQALPFLYEPTADKSLPILPMMGSPAWHLDNDYSIEKLTGKDKSMNGKIALIERGKVPFYEKAKQAEEAGAKAVIIYNNEKGGFQGSVENDQEPITIPVAAVTQQTGRWLQQKMQEDTVYLETKYQQTDEMVTEFSSRGPVTIDWDIKPEVIAPGANILSTVPEGYRELQGTSMAAPHVTGALALLKEAHPDWSVKQLEGALKTTALPLKGEGNKLSAPIDQGMGQIRPDQASKTRTIIDDPLLSFGKVNGYRQDKTATLVIENTTNKDQSYSFDIPKHEQGLHFQLPQTFTVEANERKKVQIKLGVTSQVLDKGIHQGWVTLHQGKQIFHLPYLFVNQTADFPKAMGFDLALKPLSDDSYKYELYVTEQAKRVEVQLYQAGTLLYDRPFITIDNPNIGLNEGEMTKHDLGDPGTYKALITVELENGDYESYETELEISNND